VLPHVEPGRLRGSEGQVFQRLFEKIEQQRGVFDDQVCDVLGNSQIDVSLREVLRVIGLGLVLVNRVIVQGLEARLNSCHDDGRPDRGQSADHQESNSASPPAATTGSTASLAHPHHYNLIRRPIVSLSNEKIPNYSLSFIH